jgi:hypothetical protein
MAAAGILRSVCRFAVYGSSLPGTSRYRVRYANQYAAHSALLLVANRSGCVRYHARGP